MCTIVSILCSGMKYLCGWSRSDSVNSLCESENLRRSLMGEQASTGGVVSGSAA